MFPKEQLDGDSSIVLDTVLFGFEGSVSSNGHVKKNASF